MKVMMLGWELPPHHAGGMGIACYQMCEEIAATGVDIEFILPYTADFDIPFMKVTPAHKQSVNAVKFAGGVYDSEYFTSMLSTTSDFGVLDLRRQHDLFAHNVATLAEAKEYDIIHAHDWLTFRAGIAAKLVSGKPLIVHVHSTQYDQSAGGHGNPIAREIEYEGLSMADQIFAVSEHTKRIIVREYGIDHGKIRVVHNSMKIADNIDESHNVHSYLYAMKQFGYKIVISIGRKTIQKGLTHLLEAAAKTISVDPKVLFVLAGSGEQEEELLQLAADYGISKNVVFINWLQGKQLRDTYKIGDVFIMPSVSEPFGLTALEAIGYGSPVIVSKQSGVAEVLQNCFKVDYWDTDKMADMIYTITNNQSLARTMWAHSYEEYKSQSWKTAATQMNDHYNNLHNRRVMSGAV